MLYVPALAGVHATTRYGERGVIVGPAFDPARCTFRPFGPAGVMESFTPRIQDLTFS